MVKQMKIQATPNSQWRKEHNERDDAAWKNWK